MSDEPGPPRAAPRPVWPHVALAIYVASALFCLTWPGYDLLGNRVDPRVFGLPFNMAWVAGWALASCVVMGAYLFVTEREDDP